MRKLFLFLIVIIVMSCTNDNIEDSVLSETTISSMENSLTSKNEVDALKFVALTGSTKIPLKEAKELALFTANKMREVEGITTKAPLKIKNVEVIKNGIKKNYVETKADKEVAADLYLLNFANNQGYVLTSADRRVPGVFAYNSKGNLGDTIYNPGQEILLERVLYYMDKKKEEFNKNRLKLAVAAQEEIFKKLSKEQQEELIKKGLFDKNGKRIITKKIDEDCFALPGSDGYDEPEYNEPPRYSYGAWETVYKKAPLVKTLWSQSGSYNNKVDKYCSEEADEAPVGCVAVAVGQIMSYHKKPTYFKGEYMDWNDMTYIRSGDMFSQIYYCNKEGKDDIQHLLARLGDNEYLNMNYGCDDGSGASDNKAEETFHKLGYSANLTDYNSNTVISEIKANRPVYISGYAFKKKLPWYKRWKRKYVYDGGHAWLVDGYVKRTREVTVTERNNECIKNELSDAYTTYTYNENLELVHNNFGWGGDEKGGDNTAYYDNEGNIVSKSKTGWYHKNLFDSNNFRDETSNTYKSGTSGNYQYKNQIITNIK